jgi:hypothetical protein
MPHSEELSSRLMRPERWFGGLIAVLLCSANVNQPLTNAPVVINFDTTNIGPFGLISRTGSDINILLDGYYSFVFQPQVQQNAPNNITTLWARKNGVDVPGSAIKFSSTGVNDISIPVFAVTARLFRGDVIQFLGQTSIAFGSTLVFFAAGGGFPSSVAAILDVRGFGPVA